MQQIYEYYLFKKCLTFLMVTDKLFRKAEGVGITYGLLTCISSKPRPQSASLST